MARPSDQPILVPLVQSGGLGRARTLLNPKPPDPEAAFAFPALPQATIFEITVRPSGFPTRRPPMSRMPTGSANAASAFDFDVVTDAAPIPVRRPARDEKTAERMQPPSDESAGERVERRL
jgi:hypothetical protein